MFKQPIKLNRKAKNSGQQQSPLFAMQQKQVEQAADLAHRRRLNAETIRVNDANFQMMHGPADGEQAYQHEMMPSDQMRVQNLSADRGPSKAAMAAMQSQSSLQLPQNLYQAQSTPSISIMDQNRVNFNSNSPQALSRAHMNPRDSANRYSQNQFGQAYPNQQADQ